LEHGSVIREIREFQPDRPLYASACLLSKNTEYEYPSARSGVVTRDYYGGLWTSGQIARALTRKLGESFHEGHAHE